MVADKKKTGFLRVESTFGKSVAVLVGGTAFSQALVLLALPILTRLFSPEDFSDLAIFMAAFAIVSSVACLRYEVAIPIVGTDAEAATVAILGVLIGGIVSLVVLISLVLILAINLEFKVPGYYLWLLPFGVLSSGFYFASQYWFSRNKRFDFISKNRVERALWGGGVQILGGCLGIFPLLVLGQIIIFSGFGFRLAREFLREISPYIKSANLTVIREIAQKHKRFALYSVPETLLNNGATHFPIIILSFFIAGPELGFLMLATKLLGGPVTLIGGAISQVYLSYAGRRRGGEISDITLSSIRPILILFTPALIIFSFCAPPLFGVVFGKEWAAASDYLLWMLPWFVLKLISSPISMSLHITGNQKLAFNLQLFGFLIRNVAVIVSVLYFTEIAIVMYALSGAVFYFLYCIAVLFVTKISFLNFAREIAISLPFLALSFSVGFYIEWCIL